MTDITITCRGYMRHENLLTAVYGRWLKANDLPEVCAFDLIHEDGLTHRQRNWLSRFICAWDRALDLTLA